MSNVNSVYQKTIAQQRLVARPEASAWVAANAGAGKTKVLTDRVMRLLLTGAPPSRILCITFTKAAAAEMAERLFHRLGEWALMDDETLKKQLSALDEKPKRSATELSGARRLFARALETPGGLKIQTIHSFCESVLKRFPLEAGVSPGFTVLEEQQSETALLDIIGGLAVELSRQEKTVQDTFFQLTKKIDEQSLRQEIYNLSRDARKLRRATEGAGGEVAYWQEMESKLGIIPGESIEICQVQFMTALDKVWLEGAYSAFLSSTKTYRARAEWIKILIESIDPIKIIKAADKLFLTATGAPRVKIADKGTINLNPEIEDRLRNYQQMLLAMHEKCKSFEIVQTSKGIHHLALKTEERYSEYKKNNGFLDFDDLIYKTAELFKVTAPEWVLYKLDQGIDHILLDEAQDTSDSQWQVVMQPLLEFFAGAGTREFQRTMFVVGDEKQSIYSFQGADVGLFREQQSKLARLIIPTGQDFNVQNLTLSFRSTSPVLRFVDAVFAEPEAASGVSEHADLCHTSFRADDAGLVELWPLVERQEGQRGNPWDAPVDMPDIAHPARLLANHIAGKVAGWIEAGDQLESAGRAIRPGDVMILCQRRGPIFHEVVRALTRLKVPTAGADRLKLTEHIAVLDMLSAARFSLQTRDDLSLAELLKSPLFGFADGDLFEIACGRPRGESLWQSLCSVAENVSENNADCLFKFAVESITAARSVAQMRGPFAFFSFLLESGSPSGWERFYSRFGAGVREVLGEFLNEALAFENGEPRTLQGFCAYFDRLKSDLKREIDGTENLVRVMTVHGSKGLEANIVFLADAAYSNFAKGSSFLPLGQTNSGKNNEIAYSPDDGFPVRVSSKHEDNSVTRRARDYAEASRAEEYRRLFYVAATRARDRLYICGQTTGKASAASILEKPVTKASWYALATAAFNRLGDKGMVEEVGAAPWGGTVLRIANEQKATVSPTEENDTTTHAPLPGWLKEPAHAESAMKRMQPSKISFDEIDSSQLAPFEAPFRPTAVGVDGFTPYTRGNALHLLLEKLPNIDPAHRVGAASELLRKNFAQVSAEIVSGWVDEVMTILRDPKFEDVFGPNSRAEVPVIGTVMHKGEERIISGQIDRLIVTDNKVLIVDYKSNRPPPASVNDIPAAYVTQLAAYQLLVQEIYPGREISCALLWTWEARLMEVPGEQLAHAVVH